MAEGGGGEGVLSASPLVTTEHEGGGADKHAAAGSSNGNGISYDSATEEIM